MTLLNDKNDIAAAAQRQAESALFDLGRSQPAGAPLPSPTATNGKEDICVQKKKEIDAIRDAPRQSEEEKEERWRQKWEKENALQLEAMKQRWQDTEARLEAERRAKDPQLMADRIAAGVVEGLSGVIGGLITALIDKGIIVMPTAAKVESKKAGK